MNEKSCLNEAVFVFAVQSCFWKKIIFFDPGYLVMANMPDFTNNKQIGQLCTLVVRREKRKKKHK